MRAVGRQTLRAVRSAPAYGRDHKNERYDATGGRSAWVCRDGDAAAEMAASAGIMLVLLGFRQGVTNSFARLRRQIRTFQLRLVMQAQLA